MTSASTTPLIRRTLVAVLAAAFVLVLGTSPLMAQRSDKDCSRSSIGATPLNDLGTGDYEGAQGGLYPEGRNEVPADHLRLGLQRAAEVVPRDAAGQPDPSGRTVLISVGMSNTYREFRDFERAMAGRRDLADDVVIVNAAQGGQDLTEWMGGARRPWEYLDGLLSENGVTREQVQVAWIKLTDRPAAGLPFPETALSFRDKTTELLQQLQDRFPNLQIAYLSSRIYGGYNDVSSPSPEPLAYQEGFGVKWVIERQMNGDAALDAEPDGGARAPWAAWGPYLWADGTSSRSDGLNWDCRNFRGDGVHPERTGTAKVADQLTAFFEAEPTAAWMWNDRELPSPPAVAGDIAPPSTIAGDTGVVDDGDEEPTTTTTTTSAPATTSTTAANDTASDTQVTDTTATTTTTVTAVPDTPARSSPSGGAPAVLWMLLGAGLTLGIVSVVIWWRLQRT